MTHQKVARVSVALCTFNGARYLAAQLGSILNGTLRPSEIVVSDDGSTDSSTRIVRDHAGHARTLGVELLLVDGPHAGVARNFEATLQRATGDIVFLADQDDVWHPERLARGVALHASRPDVMVMHGDARLIDGEGRPIGSGLFDYLEVRPEELEAIRSGRAFRTYLRRNLATGATMSVRREFVERALPIPDGWLHDEWLAILAAAEDAITVTGDALIDYRLHDENQVGAARPTLVRKVARVLLPDAERNRELARRSGALFATLDRSGAPPEVLDGAREKWMFENRRAALPRFRPARLPGVLSAAAAHQYRRYASQGWKDILRDLLQPR